MKPISSFFRIFSVCIPGTCLVILCFLIACASPAKTAETTAGNNHLLVVHLPFPDGTYTPIIREFERRTGIWVETDTAEHTDLILGGDSFLLRSEPDRYERIIPFSASPIVIVYNPRLIQMTPPNGWLSLFDSMWTGRIAYEDPADSAVSMAALCAMTQSLSAESVEDPDALAAYGLGANPAGIAASWFRQLDCKTVPDADSVITSVTDGSCYAGITSEARALTARRGGLDITIVYPVEGTSVHTSCTAIVKGCAHPDNARKFEEFLQTDDVQRYLPDRVGSRSPYAAAEYLTSAYDQSDNSMLLRSEPEDASSVPQEAKLRPLSKIPLLPDHEEWSAGQWKTLLSAWLTVSGEQNGDRTGRPVLSNHPANYKRAGDPEYISPEFLFNQGGVR